MGVKVRFYKGAWWIFINHNGRRKAKKVGDRATAERVARELRERFLRAEFSLPSGDHESFSSYANTWLETILRTLKGSTVRFYRDNVENHLTPILGSIPLQHIDRGEVKRLIIALTAKGLRPRTITGILRTLSTILSEAVEDGKLQANPALRPSRRRRRLRDPNAPKKRDIDAFTRDEVGLLLATAAEHYADWHTFLLCALRTGLRLGELRALEWGDLDWRQRFVRVERNFVEGVFTTPKNGLSRNVDMSLQLRAVLRLWRFQQRAVWLRRGRSLPDVDASNVRKAVLAVVKKADARRRRSVIHVLRHTFASLLIQQGESLITSRNRWATHRFR